MTVDTLVLGDYQVNCYIVSKETLNKSSAADQRIFCSSRAVLKMGNTQSIPPLLTLSSEAKPLADSSCRFNQSFPNSGSAVIIDPGYDPETVSAFLEGKQLVPQAILLTHGHFDHVGGVKALAEKYKTPVYLHPADLSLPPFLTRPVGITEDVDEGGTVTAAGLSFRVLHTPGHTGGSVCYLVGDALFSGDTLFAGSCGRTDFPGGSDAAIRASLRRLAALPGDLTVYPGHGGKTTLRYEREHNPYM